MQATISLLFNSPTSNELSACRKWGDHELNVIGFDSRVMREAVFSTLMCIGKIEVHSFVDKFLMLKVHLFEDGGSRH